MRTDHPTVEVFFVYALTHCRLRVYQEEEVFARRLLEGLTIEFLKPEDSDSWQEIDTRVLLHLVGQAIVKMLPGLLPQPAEVAKQAAVAWGIVR